MPNTDQQEHIARIAAERAKNDANSVSLASAIAKDIETGFKGGAKYIHEIVQNTDDAGLVGELVELTIILHENYLIFSHTGKHFSAADVDKLCDYAQQLHQDKAKDVGTTGFKGIGFKAVFSISDSVSIISGGYSFCFDKGYWQHDTAPYPWQLIPVWTEVKSFPPHIQPLIDHERVNIVVQLRDVAQVESVKADLHYVLAKPQILLMLRRLRRVDIITDVRHSIQINVDGETSMRQVCIDDQIHSTWAVRPVRIKIAAEMRDVLAALSDFACPPKLKLATDTVITYAYPVKNGRLVSLEKMLPLYTYLPTETCFFPFLVNADFLLNPERTALIENKWNIFLLQTTARCHIFSLHRLAEQPQWRKQVLNALALPRLPAHTKTQFADAYTTGFKQGLSAYPFVAVTEDDRVLAKYNACWLDDSAFHQHFTEIDDPEYPKATRVVDDVESLKKLYTLPGFSKSRQVFTLETLLKKLPEYAEQSDDLGFHVRMMRVLFDISQRRKKLAYGVYREGELLDRLQEIPFLLTAEGQCCAPNTLYLSAGELALPADLQVQTVHPAIVHTSDISREFLRQLGLRECTPAELVKGIIKQALLVVKDAEYAVVLLQFVFDAYVAEQVTRVDLKELTGVRVLTMAGSMCPANTCYLSGDYREAPIQADALLQAGVPILAPSYLRDGDDVVQWYQFFSCLGVRDLFAIRYIKHCTYEHASKNIPGFAEYTRAFTFSKRYHSRSKKGDYLTDLIYIPILDYFDVSPTLQAVFWQQWVKNYRRFRQHRHISYCYASHSGGNRFSVDNFFIFQLRRCKNFLATNGRYYRASDLYAPQFKSVFGRALPVVDIATTLAGDMVELFGFKDSLDSIFDCGTLLRAVSESSSPERVLVVHGEVFRALLRLQPTPNQFGDIWLLSANNQLCLASSLRYSTRSVSFLNISRELKIYPGFTVDEMLQLCSLFGVGVIEKPEYSLQIEGEQTIVPDILARLKDKLPLLACFEARHRLQDAKHVLLNLARQCVRLTFVAVDKLVVTDEATGDSKPAKVYLDDAMLYFVGRWSQGILKKRLLSFVANYLQLSERLASDLLAIFDFQGLSDRYDWLDECELERRPYEELAEYMQSDEFSAALEGAFVQVESREVVDDAMTLVDMPPSKSDAVVAVSRHEVAMVRRVRDSTAAMISSFTALAVPDVDRGFNPRVEPTDVKFEDVEYTSASITQPVLPHDLSVELPETADQAVEAVFEAKRAHTLRDVKEQPAEVLSPSSGEARNESGRWSEACVYVYLAQYYQKKYPSCHYQETDSGFILSGHNSLGAPISLQLIWPNKYDESGAHYDFKIIRTLFGSHGKTDERYIDVKGTVSHGAAEFSISRAQWQTMQLHEDRYRIFRVYAAGTSSPSIHKIKNPAGLVVAGDLVPKELKFRV